MIIRFLLVILLWRIVKAINKLIKIVEKLDQRLNDLKLDLERIIENEGVIQKHDEGDEEKFRVSDKVIFWLNKNQKVVS